MVDVVYIYYDEEFNLFRDVDDGSIIYDIYTYLTPQALMLFLDDRGENVFYMRDRPGVLCEIISSVEEGEVMNFLISVGLANQKRSEDG